MAVPNNTPMIKTSRITIIGGQPCCSRLADTIVVKAIMEPTDKSIPPETITKVMPTAAISRKALSINRLSSTCIEKKPV
ncbi:hypothetical protein D3C76_1416420 [compost metagenome]